MSFRRDDKKGIELYKRIPISEVEADFLENESKISHERTPQHTDVESSSEAESKRGIENKETTEEKETTDKSEEEEDNALSNEMIMFFIMSFIVGSSLIKTPFLFKYTGWSGSGVIVATALLTAYTSMLITGSYIENRKQNPQRLHFYGNIFESFGIDFNVTCTFVFIFYILATCVAVLNEASKILYILVNYKFTGISKGNQLRIMIATILMIILPITMLKSPRRYSMIAQICASLGVLTGLLLTTLLGSSKQGHQGTENFDQSKYVIAISSSVCSLIRFYGLHAVLPTLLNDIKDINTSPKIVLTSFVTPTIFVVIVGMMSYLAFGVNLLHDLFQSIEIASDPKKSSFTTVTVIIIRVFLIFQSIFVFIFSINALNIFFEASLLTSKDPIWKNYLIRIFSSTIVALVAIAKPELTVVFEYASSILACIVCVILPLVLSIDSSKSKSHEYIFHGICIFLVSSLLGGSVYGYLSGIHI